MDSGSVRGGRGRGGKNKRGGKVSLQTVNIERHEEEQRRETSALCQRGDEQMEGERRCGEKRRRSCL